MNIFWLSLDFHQNASMYSNEHCIKIILEITQCLFSALHHHGNLYEDDSWKDGMSKVYKQAHAKHPIVLWISETPANFTTALVQGLALCCEFRKRRNKEHACERLLREMIPRIPDNEMFVPYKPDCVRATTNIPFNCTPVPVCCPKEYIMYNGSSADLTASYINYYRHKKLRFDSGRIATFHILPELFADDYRKLFA